MSTATLIKTHHGLPRLSLFKPYKNKSRKSKRKMASHRLDVPQMGTEAGPNARVKRFHSKSRKGCFTCRQRRVKCDEQRNPNCGRCDKGGYVCEWHDNRPGRSHFSEDRLGSTSTTRSPSLATLRSDDDTVSHRFFSDGIVANVARLFTDMAESFIGDLTRAQYVSSGVSKFYYQCVYQACQSSHIIRKTLTALCGLHERAFASSRSSSPRNHEYITRYSEAVTDLRTSSEELGPEIVLIASILFANCEYLMGDLCSAVRHLRAGARILIEHRHAADGRLSPELSETLETIFEAFDHDTMDLDGATPGSDYFDTIGEHQFDDLNQANHNLLQIYSHTFALRRVNQEHSRHVSLAAHDFQRWSASWRSRTTDLESTLDMEQLPWLHLLQGQHTALNTVIDTITNAIEPTPFDYQLDDLILQVSTFLQTCVEFMHGPSIAERPFLENVGLILPLLLIILRCPDSQTCETALSLLGRLRVSEATWNSCCAYAVARSVINARHAMRFNNSNPTYAFNGSLPVADIRKVTLLSSGTELDVTFVFPYNQGSAESGESNTIVGGFCIHDAMDMSKICSVLEAGGFQGPVTTQPLPGCFCHDHV